MPELCHLPPPAPLPSLSHLLIVIVVVTIIADIICYRRKCPPTKSKNNFPLVQN